MVAVVSPANTEPRLVAGVRVTDLFGAARALGGGPQSFLVEQPLRPPGSSADAHFHVVDQFQVFVGGNGRLGKDPIRPIAVHYADRHTTYGPFVYGTRRFEWVTARVKADPGGRPMPESRHELVKPRGRYLIVHVPDLPNEITEPDRIELIERSDDGLAAEVVMVPAGATGEGPSPAGTSGQHYFVLGGELMVEGQSYSWLSNVFVSAGEAAPGFTAGRSGLALLALSFPYRSAA